MAKRKITTGHQTKLNLVAGGGGLKAMMAAAANVFLLWIAGLEKDDFETIGGASGGGLMMAVYAGGMHPLTMLHMAVKFPFNTLLTKKSVFRALFGRLMRDDIAHLLAGLLRRRHAVLRPKEGIYSSEKMGDFLRKHVKRWPKNLWLVAADGDTFNQVLFTAEGSFEYLEDGSSSKLSAEPPEIGLAGCATSAIPYILGAVGRFLDGCLTFDGKTPVAVVQRHFKQPAEKTIVIDVWDDPKSHSLLRRLGVATFWTAQCGGVCPQSGRFPSEFYGTILSQSEMSGKLGNITIQFDAPSDIRWQAIMAAFESGITAFSEHGILHGKSYCLAVDILEGFRAIEKSARLPGELSRCTWRMITRTLENYGRMDWYHRWWLM